MTRPRIIPTLLLRESGLVKTRAFGVHDYVGDPINAVHLFNELRADELMFLDITATEERRSISLDFVRIVGEEARMPFAVGGGIRTLQQIRAVLGAGAEKVVLGTIALEDPAFVAEAAEHFGSSTIVVCIDVRRGWLSEPRAYSARGRRRSSYTPEAFARLMEQRGAGEVVVQSVDRDGMMGGYDVELVRRVSAAVSIPTIALGGAGNLSHLRAAFVEGHASALAAGSLFVFQGPKRGVLINYPDRHERMLVG